MAHVSFPRTPTPQISREHSVTTSESRIDVALDFQSRNATITPPPLLSLTPPPSSQVPKSSGHFAQLDKAKPEQRFLASPPATLKTPQVTHYEKMLNSLPTAEVIMEMQEPQLRDLALNLLPALGEARMSFAHAKLQHSLLSIETAEAAQRAAVEHEMTRREVEVLQMGSPILRNRASTWTDSRSPQNTPSQLDLTLKHSHQLQIENARLERRLKQAKRVIKHLDGKNTELAEDNHLLRQRIKQNRDHIEAMRSSGVLSARTAVQPAPNTSSHRPTIKINGSARVGGQDPFDALLFAGQVLSGETTSVPSTPTHARKMKFSASHTRGTHSLSSLPTTPNRSRPMTADNVLLTPTNRAIQASHLSFSAPTAPSTFQKVSRRREDRDSTISASDNEEAFTDDDVPASQASQVATSILRRFSEQTQNGNPSSTVGSQEAIRMPSKSSGKVTKSRFNRFEHQDMRDGDSRVSSDDIRASKKLKLGEAMNERLGLGIGWPSPS